jgi:hypothetical protein
MPQLDLLIPPRGLQPFGDASCADAEVVAVTPQGAYVVLPGYDRWLRWGPCEPSDAVVSVGETVAVIFTNTGAPYLIGAGGGGGGEPGPAGQEGPPGPKGATGAEGPPGPKGTTGAEGAKGTTGSTGPQGVPGPTGPKGETGPAGPKGETGATGPKGETGAAGPESKPGDAAVGIAYRSAAQTIPVGGLTRIALDTVVKDGGGNLSVAAGQGFYTVPTDGAYEVSGSVGLYQGTEEAAATLSIAVNGTEAIRGNQIWKSIGSLFNAGLVVAGIVSVKKGDKIELVVHATGESQPLETTVAPYANRLQIAPAAAEGKEGKPGPAGAPGPEGKGPAEKRVATGYRNAKQKIVANGFRRIEIDTVDHDPGGTLNVAAGQGYYVAPVEGFYEVTGNWSTPGVPINTTLLASIGVSGVETVRSSRTTTAVANQEVSLAVAGVVFCKAGDKIELLAYSTAELETIVGTMMHRLMVAPAGTEGQQGKEGPAGPEGKGPGEKGIANGHRVAKQALPAITHTRIQIDTADRDPGGNLNVTAGQGYYVAPAEGFYEVSGMWEAPATASGPVMQASIGVNGTEVVAGSQLYSTQAVVLVVAGVVFCKAGDHIELLAYSSYAIETPEAPVIGASPHRLMVAPAANEGKQGPQGPAGIPGTISGTPPLVSVLPGSPNDGQEVYYLADAANGVIWHLRYRAASPNAAKWELVGGGELESYQAEAKKITLASSSYVLQALEKSPTITVPLAGAYAVRFAFQYLNTEAAPGGTVECQAYVGTSPSIYWQPGLSVITAVQYGGNGGASNLAAAALTAGAVLKLYVCGNSTIANLWQMGAATMHLRPVRVGP